MSVRDEVRRVQSHYGMCKRNADYEENHRMANEAPHGAVWRLKRHVAAAAGRERGSSSDHGGRGNQPGMGERDHFRGWKGSAVQGRAGRGGDQDWTGSTVQGMGGPADRGRGKLGGAGARVGWGSGDTHGGHVDDATRGPLHARRLGSDHGSNHGSGHGGGHGGGRGAAGKPPVARRAAVGSWGNRTLPPLAELLEAELRHIASCDRRFPCAPC